MQRSGEATAGVQTSQHKRMAALTTLLWFVRTSAPQVRSFAPEVRLFAPGANLRTAPFRNVRRSGLCLAAKGPTPLRGHAPT